MLAPGDLSLTFKHTIESPVTLVIEQDYVTAVQGAGADIEHLAHERIVLDPPAGCLGVVLAHLVGQSGFVFLPGEVRPPSRAPALSHHLSGIAPAFVRWQIRLAPGEEIGR